MTTFNATVEIRARYIPKYKRYRSRKSHGDYWIVEACVADVGSIILSGHYSMFDEQTARKIAQAGNQCTSLSEAVRVINEM